MKIKMKYPDNSIHIIVPRKLIDVGNNIFILDYRDETLSSDMQTIIVEENGNFFKQPLKQYGISWRTLLEYKEMKGKEVSLNILPQMISCKNPVSDIKFLSSFFVSSLRRVRSENVLEPEAISSTLIPIYHNLYDDKYYWDKECRSLIEGGLESLKGYQYDIIDVYVAKIENASRKKPFSNSSKVETLTILPIYHNLYDDMYYWDKECNNLIEGGLESLKGYNYKIIDVFVKKGSYSDADGKKTSSVSSTRSITIIYFNEVDRKYYWDKECRRVISDVPDSLGFLVGNYIIGNEEGIVYQIEKVKIKNSYDEKDSFNKSKNGIDAKVLGMIQAIDYILDGNNLSSYDRNNYLKFKDSLLNNADLINVVSSFTDKEYQIVLQLINDGTFFEHLDKSRKKK